MRIFERDEEAVSPVIGVILMVAITVILAAVIAAFVFGLSGSQQAAPTASITAANNPDTANEYDLKIQHKGGDTLKAGDWKLSVVVVGQPPSYVISNNTQGELSVGSQIKVSTMTDGSAAVTNRTVTLGTNLTATKYDIKLVHVPTNSMLLDAVVEVR